MDSNKLEKINEPVLRSTALACTVPKSIQRPAFYIYAPFDKKLSYATISKITGKVGLLMTETSNEEAVRNGDFQWRNEKIQELLAILQKAAVRYGKHGNNGEGRKDSIYYES